MDGLRYVPALPVRAGSLSAFEHVRPILGERAQPLWVIPPAAAPAELPTYLRDSARALNKANDLHPGWLDTRHIEAEHGLVTEQVWPHLSATLLGPALRPVTGPERDPAQQWAAAELAADAGGGLGVRLRARDIGKAETPSLLAELLARVNAATSDVDLLVDLGEVTVVREAVTLALRAWEGAGRAADWRSTVLLGGSFPWSADGLKRREVTALLRVEWAAWQELRQAAGNGKGNAPAFVFGDYSTLHPRTCDEPPPRHPPRVHERPRYTTGEYFLVGKGRQLGSGEPSLMRPLAQAIVADAEFREGATEAERWLSALAADADGIGPGNPEGWVRRGHLQHLAFVTGQVGTA